MIRKILVTCALLVLVVSGCAMAAITEQEAAQLGGSTYTPIGAEKAGNKDGTIPPWTGGITKGADGYYYEGKLVVPFSAYDSKKPGIHPDPFAGDKVLFSINSKNMSQYADKLTPGQMALMQKYPGYRIDVYPTRRKDSYHPTVIEGTKKAALTATLGKSGASLENAHCGYPFPFPKNGIEAMWNHLVTPNRGDEHVHYYSQQITASGRYIMTSEEHANLYYAYWDPQAPDKSKVYYARDTTDGPSNRNGEKLWCYWGMDKTGIDPTCYQYLPGQRRVKLAPEISFDGPNTWVGGAATYDQAYTFMGSPERYNWELKGKKEMYIPVNNYKLMFHSTRKAVFGPQFVNPDYVRWELHRVWMLEGKVKPEFRHVYPKRTIYLDEDNWYGCMADMYDANGKLWRTEIDFNPFIYSAQATHIVSEQGYDLNTGQYFMSAYPAETGGITYTERAPVNELTSTFIGSSGIR
jgi:hypothetical protein